MGSYNRYSPERMLLTINITTHRVHSLHWQPRHLQQCLQSHYGLNYACTRQGTITAKQLRWAFSMLLSRLVRLPALGNVEALVPFADFRQS